MSGWTLVPNQSDTPFPAETTPQVQGWTPVQEPAEPPAKPSAPRSSQPDYSPMMGNGMPTEEDYSSGGEKVGNVLGRIKHGADTGMNALLDMPGQIYHAFKDDPRNPREAKEADMAPGAGHLMLGFNRMITDPMEANLRRGKQDFDAGKTSEGLGHTVSGAIPVIGPFAGHMGEAIGEDPAAGLGEGAVYMFAPKITGDAIIKGPAPMPRFEPPDVWNGEAPAEIPQGRQITEGSDAAEKAKAFAKVLGREVTGKVPLLNRFDSFRTPTLREYLNALRAKAPVASNTEVPVLGNVSNAEARAPYQPYQGDLSVKPEQPQIAPRVAPIQGASQSAQTFFESTPEEIAANDARIKANLAARQKVAPEPQTVGSTTGAANDTALFQAAKEKLGPNASISDIAQEAQRMKMEGSAPDDRNFPHTASGEIVLNQALTSLDNKTLLKIARSRGINVTAEAQLKPGMANTRIINKIIDDMSPEELADARDQGIEMSRNKPVQNPDISPEKAAEAWHYKVLNTFFPDVAMPKTMAARAQATIAKRPLTPQQSAIYSAAASKANALTLEDMNPGTSDWSLDNMTKQILMNRAKKAVVGNR